MAALPSDVPADLKQSVAELERELRARTAERDEALAQQTATAEILRVINSSPGNVLPVFNSMLEKAMRLCSAAFGYLMTYDGERFHPVARHGLPPGFAEYLARMNQPGQTGAYARILAGASLVHIADLRDGDVYRTSPLRQALVDLGGARTGIIVALRKDASLLAVLTIYRQEVRPFSDRQIELLESFAAQAVIAMENARLLGETREALAQQTATAEVLKIINASPGDLAPVFDAMLEKATLVCAAEIGTLWTYDGEWMEPAATRGASPAFAEFLRRTPRHLIRDTQAYGYLTGGKRFNQTADLAATEGYRSGQPLTRAGVDLGGIRTLLTVPLHKDERLLGHFGIYRREVRPFSDRQIELLESFAAQAVIAMENARLLGETREALAQQTATAEILQVINSSPGDLAPVFDAILEKAHSLCDAPCGSLQIYDGEQFRAVAVRGIAEPFAAILREGYRPGTDNLRLSAGERSVQIADMADFVAHSAPDDPILRATAVLVGTLLVVPLRKDGILLGRIMAARQEVRPFSDKQIALLENFAAQAVIAMENARLLGELRQRTGDLQESLDYQSATSEVLKVISRSTFDLDTVLQTLVESAGRLCQADKGTITRQRDGVFYRAEAYGFSPEFVQFAKGVPVVPERGTITGRTLVEGRVVHVPDVLQDPEFKWTRAQELGDFRTILGVPMLREGAPIGVMAFVRSEVRPFTQKQIELVSTFADQAVIAIENTRLFGEVEARARELSDALDRQTATGEVLNVISRSNFELKPVFDTIVATASRLCDAEFAIMFTLRDGLCHLAASNSATAEFVRHAAEHPIPPGHGSLTGRVVLERRTISIPDCLADPDYTFLDYQGSGRYRSMLGVPLLRDGVPLGVIVLMRTRVQPFTDKQVELVTTFADQAVIAMENARLMTEQREALERQTATAEVLQVINSSPGDLAPVFSAMLDKATRLCEAFFGVLHTFDGERFHAAALHGAPPSFVEFMSTPRKYGPGTALGRIMRGEHLIHILDLKDEEVYRSGDPIRRATVDLAGARSFLAVALRKDDVLLGTISVYRQEVRPFTDKQIALFQSFAAQAVIAMENARLLGELRQRTDDLEQSLEYQTATGDVLKAISRTGFSLGPVLQMLVETAARLCEADQGAVFRMEEERHRLVASTGMAPEYVTFLADNPFLRDRSTLSGRTALERRVVHIEDAANDPEYTWSEAQKRGNLHTGLGVPLLRDDELIGVVVLYRMRVERFTEKQIALVKTFSDQAVIAIENARLLGNLRDRTDDLQESLDYQTATSDVLKVISRSTFDLQPVLDTLVETASKLCDADMGMISSREGDAYRVTATFAVSPAAEAVFQGRLMTADRGTVTGRAAIEGRVVHVADVAADPDYALPETVTVAKVKTVLGVPLLREDVPVGVITLARERAQPFTERQIELVRTFADQAVIAIENARLLGELRARTDELAQRQAELRVTFENMGDGVAMFDEGLRLAAWNRKFQQILDLPDAFLAGRPSYGDYFRHLAGCGEFGAIDVEAELRGYIESVGEQWSYERTRPNGRVVEVRHNPVPSGGFVLIYADITERKRSEAEIRAARDAAEEASRTIDAAYRELKAAQANLIQAEKMASLGQLTAGIAHEIKNPLNFVNNFASLSVGLLGELRETAAPAIAALDESRRAEAGEIIGMLVGNLEKIAEHGRRADGIVKSMLAHSRGGVGQPQSVDLNALVEESLNLAYHGARAHDRNFNIALERDLDPAIGPIELVPQDVTRVFLNLCGNGFYAADERRKAGEADFRPMLKVTTRELGDAVEMRIRDNGTGIPPEIRDKLFQPFFTTKPTGQGTGLGLSISYDIITQQHGGTIAVDSRVGEFTEFTIRLPRRRQGAGMGAS